MSARSRSTRAQIDAAQDTLTPELLQALLDAARAKLDELARSIGAVDAELESLSAARAQHRALQTACDALDELGAIGGAELFWDGSTPAGARDEHMRRVRARIEEFHAAHRRDRRAPAQARRGDERAARRDRDARRRRLRSAGRGGAPS